MIYLHFLLTERRIKITTAAARDDGRNGNWVKQFRRKSFARTLALRPNAVYGCVRLFSSFLIYFATFLCSDVITS